VNRTFVLFTIIAGYVLSQNGFAQDSLFSSPINYPVGTKPYSVFCADFNNDSKYDIVTANWGTNSISILLNTGDGIFDPAIEYNVGAHPRSVYSNDLDGDGDYDIAVANVSSDNISILFNNGDGTFQDTINYNADLEPAAVVAEDFDGDLDNDLAVANYESANVYIYLNDSTGSFQQIGNYNTGDGSISIAVSDMDNDGDLDLAVANDNDDNVSILINNGDALFQSSVNYTTGNAPYSITASDINNDGYMDLAVANELANPFGVDSISILINNGDGTFQPTENITTGDGPFSICSGDINSDGYNDLATANHFSNNVSIILNDSAGTFQTPVNFETGYNPSSVFSTDFDNDGDLDLAVANLNSNNVSILLNQTPQIITTNPIQNELYVSRTKNIEITFNQNIDVNTINDSSFFVWSRSGGRHLGTYAYDSGTVSLNYDPYEEFTLGDVITVGLTHDITAKNGTLIFGGYTWSFVVEARGGNAGFTLDSAYSTDEMPVSVFAADLDNDGNIDLASANTGPSDNVSVFLNDGYGTFSYYYTASVGDDPHSISCADYNTDGYLDIATANYSNCNISVLFNNGDASFAPQSTYSTDCTIKSIFSADIDNDGDIDIVSANGDRHSISILINSGYGTFHPHIDYPIDGTPTDVFAGDFDSDGDLDLAISDHYPNWTVIILSNIGNGVFLYDSTYIVGKQPSSIIAFDFDGDGDLDIATSNRDYPNSSQIASVSILLNNGDGTFLNHVEYEVGGNPHEIFGADFDSDGDIDLATVNNRDTYPDDISILLNNGYGEFPARFDYLVGDGPMSLFCADFDLEGDIDIAVANYDSDKISIMRNTWDGSLITEFGIMEELNLTNITNHMPVFYWQYESYNGFNQNAYEVDIGTDDEWSDAELWNPPIFESSDTFVVYGGASLFDGETYYLRLRLSDGINWYGWYKTSFRMNTAPAAPVPLYPLWDEVTGNILTLWVVNSFDAEGDPLTYDFSGFHDTDCVAPIIDLQGVSEGTDSTGGQVIGPLGENCIYWWSARSFDGYEYSDGSPTQRFHIDGTPEPPSAFQIQYPPDTSGWYVFDMLSNFFWEKSYDSDPLDSVYYTLELAIDSNFIYVNTIDSVWQEWHTLTDSLEFGTQYWWKTKATDNTGLFTYSLNIIDFKTWKLGDANGDWKVDIFDITFLISYLYLEGPAPGWDFMGDINGDCDINIFDITYLISYLYINGPAPQVGCE